MTLKAIWDACGPAMVTPAIIALLTLVEITPIKINPWSAVMRFLGSRLNSDVTARLDAVQKSQTETRERLDAMQKSQAKTQERLDAMQRCQTETQERLGKHIDTDDVRDAKQMRTQILRFNDELIENREHTKEHFDEILSIIDDYKDFCKTHENFPNGKCGHAIDNINRAYDERLQKHDFL